MSDEFYIGYESRMPASIAFVMKRAVVLLVLLAAAVPALLLYAQARFTTGRFEYGTVRHFEGSIVERPYPLLDTGDALVLLVAPYKFGAAGLVEGLDGRRVRLAGTLIEREGMRMIEVQPGSIDAFGAGVAGRTLLATGSVTVRGEIVDPKCYLGVMKPATKQVHRDCAVRCLSGGIPPMLVSSAHRDGPERYLLLQRDGSALTASVEQLVGRPVAVRGSVSSLGELRFLTVDAIE